MRWTAFVLLVCVCLSPGAAQGDLTAQTTARLNLRAGPGEEYEILDILAAYIPIVIEARDASGVWRLVHTSDRQTRGWVTVYFLAFDKEMPAGALPTSAEQIRAAPTGSTPAASAPEAAQTMQTTARVHLREGPGQEHESLTVLSVGTRLLVDRRSGTWAHVQTADGGWRGWVAAGLLVEAKAVQSASGSVSVPRPAFAIGGRARAIYQRGQSLGNNPHAVSRLGDCNSANPLFLAPFDYGTYTLGETYAHLQETINHFSGSFARQGVAVFGSGSTWTLLDPTWADPAYCEAGETPLACEYRRNKPSVAFISFGTHDSPARFAADLGTVLDYLIEHGVIPVLITKADTVNDNNTIMRQVAAAYGVPLLDFGRMAQSLPNHGVRQDGARLSYRSPLDFTNAYVLEAGHAVRNLMALQMLDAICRGAMR